MHGHKETAVEVLVLCQLQVGNHAEYSGIGLLSTIKLITRESLIHWEDLLHPSSSLYSDKNLCNKNAGDLETYW